MSRTGKYSGVSVGLTDVILKLTERFFDRPQVNISIDCPVAEANCGRASCVVRVYNNGRVPLGLIDLWVEQRRHNRDTKIRKPSESEFVPPHDLRPGNPLMWNFTFPKECDLQVFVRDEKGRVHSSQVKTGEKT